MEARRFPEPEVVGSIPTAGGLWPQRKVRSRQDSNLQPLDPRSNALPLSHATGGRRHHHVRHSIVVRTPGPHPGDPGSIPGGGTFAQTALPPGFEPGLPDSRSGVLTTTLQELAADSARGAFSSVVERPFCIRKVEGSNPSSSTFHSRKTTSSRVVVSSSW